MVTGILPYGCFCQKGWSCEDPGWLIFALQLSQKLLLPWRRHGCEGCWCDLSWRSALRRISQRGAVAIPVPTIVSVRVFGMSIGQVFGEIQRREPKQFPRKKLKAMANRLTNACCMTVGPISCPAIQHDPAVTLLFVLLPAAELPSFLVSYYKALQVHKGHRVPAYQALHLGLAVGNVPSLAKTRNKATYDWHIEVQY